MEYEKSREKVGAKEERETENRRKEEKGIKRQVGR